MHVPRRAFALILVLLVSAAVFAVTMHGAVILRSATVETGAVGGKMEARRAARSAAILAMQGLIARPDSAAEPDPDSPLDADPSSPPGEAERQDEIPELPPIVRALLGDQADQIAEELEERNESRRLTRSTIGNRRTLGNDLLERVGLPSEPLAFVIDKRPVRISMTDAAGGIDVNTADGRTLRRLFEAHGMSPVEAEALANQILDWIDDDGFVRPRSLEAREYARAGVTPRNNPVPSLDELLYLPAMTPELFRELIRDLSVSTPGGPHLPTASREVLLAHGFSPSDTELIIRTRVSGGIDPGAPPLGLSPSGRALLAEARVAPSPFVRLDIDVYPVLPEVGDQPMLEDGMRLSDLDEAVLAGLGNPRRFRAVAIVGDRSVEHLAIRSAPARTEPRRVAESMEVSP